MPIIAQNSAFTTQTNQVWYCHQNPNGNVCNQIPGMQPGDTGIAGPFATAAQCSDVCGGSQFSNVLTTASRIEDVLFTTTEAISGVKAVHFDVNGNMRIAMACVSGRMPAAGVVIDNVVSGARVRMYNSAYVTYNSGLTPFANADVGKPCFVGRSGAFATSGTGSEIFTSGDIGQKIGLVFNSGLSVLVNIGNGPMYSGGLLTEFGFSPVANLG